MFSVEWTPKVYIFRIDGQETYRTKVGVSDDAPMADCAYKQVAYDGRPKCHYCGACGHGCGVGGGPSTANFTAVQGTTYHFRIGTWAGSAGRGSG